MENIENLNNNDNEINLSNNDNQIKLSIEEPVLNKDTKPSKKK